MTPEGGFQHYHEVALAGTFFQVLGSDLLHEYSTCYGHDLQTAAEL
jgi:hypothetical protein